MFTKKLMAVATVTVATMGLGASVASADVIQGDGVDLSVGAAIDGSTTSPAKAVLSTSIGNISCDSAFSSQVSAQNSGSSADAEVTIDDANGDTLTFTNCTDTIPVINVSSAVINGDITGSADAASQTLTLNGISVNVNTTAGTCTYGGNVVGDLDTGNQSLDFVNDAVSKTAGSALCPGTGGFSASYALSSPGVGFLELL